MMLKYIDVANECEYAYQKKIPLHDRFVEYNHYNIAKWADNKFLAIVKAIEQKDPEWFYNKNKKEIKNEEAKKCIESSEKDA